MHLNLPLFRDGSRLFERDLLDLAWYALGCAHWATVGAGARGFIAPAANLRSPSERWNGIELHNGTLQVRPLYLIHDGLPFVVPSSTQVIGSGDRLFAKLRIARASTGLEAGYQVEFSWDDKNPDGDYAAVALFAERRGSPSAPVFDLVPTALTPESIPELGAAHAKLLDAIIAFRRLLVAHAIRNPVDRELLMDRLERLTRFSASTPTAVLIGELHLAVRAARGFFYRLQCKERPDAWLGRQGRFRALTGAVLEYELDAIQPDPVEAGLPTELRDLEPIDTAATQLRVTLRLADALLEGGALGRLLLDRSIPPLGDFPDIPDHTIRRYDCIDVSRVLIELAGAKPGNPRFAFADAPEMAPANFQAIPLTESRTDGQKASRLDCTARYLFVSARRDTTVTVIPENA
jgi:hypothetical protein